MANKVQFLLRGALTCALLFIWSGVAVAQRDLSWRDMSWYPIVGDDGERVANHLVPAELSSAIERLDGIVVVGNRQGRITLVEFYDLNCPYCRIASVDIDDMVETDSELRLVLVPFPVLGAPSIQAGHIELAVAKLATPRQFYAFHRRIYSRRGLVDATRALEVTRELKLDDSALTALAQSKEIADVMKAHVELGNALGLAATPGFVINGVAVLGYPGRRTLQAIVDAVRTCDKIIC